MEEPIFKLIKHLKSGMLNDLLYPEIKKLATKEEKKAFKSKENIARKREILCQAILDDPQRRKRVAESLYSELGSDDEEMLVEWKGNVCPGRRGDWLGVDVCTTCKCIHHALSSEFPCQCLLHQDKMTYKYMM